MNVKKLQQQLLAIARTTSSSERVPYGFEKRVMAHLKLAPAFDEWAFCSRVLWRVAAPCVAFMLLLLAWSWLAPASKSSSNDLSVELENTLLTVADQEGPPSAEFFW